jgi:formylglycine-generating enzyme required for sulfatase activity
MTDYQPIYVNSYALVIGVDDYQHLQPLSTAVRGARDLADLLEDRFDFKVTLLADADATRAGITGWLDSMRLNAGPDDRLLIYFAGHGVSIGGKQGHLALPESRPDLLSSMLRMREVLDYAEVMTTKHLLFILDACFGGLALPVYRGGFEDKAAAALVQERAVQVMTAGDEDERVPDGYGPGNLYSLFTWLVMEGLEGKATSHGVLTARTLYEHVRTNTAEIAGNALTPLLREALGSKGDFVFSELRRMKHVVPTPPAEPAVQVATSPPVEPSAVTRPAPAPTPTARPARRGINLLWLGLGTLLVIGVIAIRSLDGLSPATMPEPTQAPTLTPEPTIDPVALALKGVTGNDEWTPYRQEFDGVPMTLVPAGCFMMGSTEEEIEAAFRECEEALGEGECPRDWFDDEKPRHEICFDEPFWIDVYEVTNAQYGSSGRWSGDNLPRENVDWFEAEAHCESRGARLPTEAEWEYAARGPDGPVYPWGNDFVADNVVYGGNSGGQTAEVGGRPGGAAWVGALDMSGNVWEWVSSIYKPYPYDAADGREVDGSSDGNSARVLRGGSWLQDFAWAAFRLRYFPNSRVDYLGFRCARSY